MVDSFTNMTPIYAQTLAGGSPTRVAQKYPGFAKKISWIRKNQYSGLAKNILDSQKVAWIGGWNSQKKISWNEEWWIRTKVSWIRKKVSWIRKKVSWIRKKESRVNECKSSI